MSQLLTPPQARPVEMFVSYSHTDSAWLGRLQPLLQFRNCQNEAYAWDDQQIQAGDRWRQRISDSLERMDIFVCLVSMEFLLSDYVRTFELPRAIEREQAGEIDIVPIVIYPHVPVEEECPELHRFNPLPQWGKCWREFESEPGDYGDAHGLIRSGLRQSVERAQQRRNP